MTAHQDSEARPALDPGVLDRGSNVPAYFGASQAAGHRFPAADAGAGPDSGATG